MKQNIVKLNENQIRQIIENSVRRTLTELKSSTYMNAARKAGGRDQYERASKFARAAEKTWKDEKKPGLLHGSQHSKKNYGFGILTPNNTENRFSNEDPHGSEFNQEYKTKPDFTKMSPEQKERYRKDMEDTARGTEELRSYYKNNPMDEGKLNRIVRESVNRVINEAWEDDYYAAMDKQDYENDIQAHREKPWYKRAFATVTGRKPKDPYPDRDLKTMRNKYTDSYNKERGFGRTYPDGTKSQLNMNWSSDSDETNGQPVLDYKHQDNMGGGIRGNRIFHDSTGKEHEAGLAYPWTEIGYTGWPESSSPSDGGQAYKDIDDINRERGHVSDVIRNRPKPRRR